MQEHTIERVLRGETETIERDGLRIARHRPCAPQVVIAMMARCERLADAAARKAAARADLVRAEAQAAAAAAARAARITGYRGPAEPANLPPEPLSSETAALRDFHALLGVLPDSRGWEGPGEIGDDTAVPLLPMPDVTLRPAPTRLAMAGQGPRVTDIAARAGRAALRADMARVALESEALARIDRCKIIDKYGRSYGTGYG